MQIEQRIGYFALAAFLLIIRELPATYAQKEQPYILAIFHGLLLAGGLAFMFRACR